MSQNNCVSVLNIVIESNRAVSIAVFHLLNNSIFYPNVDSIYLSSSGLGRDLLFSCWSSLRNGPTDAIVAFYLILGRILLLSASLCSPLLFLRINFSGRTQQFYCLDPPLDWVFLFIPFYSDSVINSVISSVQPTSSFTAVPSPEGLGIWTLLSSILLKIVSRLRRLVSDRVIFYLISS